MVPNEPVVNQPVAPAPATFKSSSPLFTLGVMSLVIVVAGWLIVSLLGVTRASQSAQLDDRLKQLDDQLKTPALQQTTTQYNTLETVLSNIKTLRDERLLFDPTWQTIKKSVPKDVQFTSFTLGDDSTFRISGVGRSVSSVAQFAAALAQQPQFKTVTPLSVDKQTNKDVYNFSISFKLVGAKQ